MVVVSAPQRLTTLHRFLHRHYVVSLPSWRQQSNRRAFRYTELAEPRQPVAPWSVEHLATSWTSPSVVASDHPAVQRILATFPMVPKEKEERQEVDASEVPKAATIVQAVGEQPKVASTKNRSKNQRSGQKKETKKASREQEKIKRVEVENTNSKQQASLDADASSDGSDKEDKKSANSPTVMKAMNIVDAVGEISGEEAEKEEPVHSKNAAPWWSSRQRQETQT